MFVLQFTKKVLFAMALAMLLADANAAALPGGLSKRTDGVLQLDFDVQRQDKKIIPQNDTEIVYSAGNVNAFEQPLINRDVSYFTKLWIGSNAQEVEVVVDTGSSDLWVIDSESGISGTYGVYDHTASSDYSYVASGFEIAYVDQSSASGNWVKDKVALSTDGPTIDSLEFGDATSTVDLQYGILGIGYKSLEAAQTPYSNLPIALKESGAISKNAYSLFLGDKGSSKGTVLFGGIDNAKYEGDLTTLPITSSSRLDVALNSISGARIGESFTLDSGSTITSMSASALRKVAQAVGAYKQISGFYYWDTCDEAQDLTFEFDGVTITVPASDVTTQLIYTNGDAFPGCAIGIQALNYNILGDNFLRHAYTVYDLDDNTISLAQVKYTDASDISTIS